MVRGVFLFIICMATWTTHLQAQSLDDLNWLTGYWTSEQNGTSTEELWLPASGGLMLGLNRAVSENGNAFFEYMRIIQNDKGIFYLASPGGGAPTSFKLVELNDQHILFENPENDFPQRIIYSEAGGTLTARIESGEGENLQHMQWTWLKTELQPK